MIYKPQLRRMYDWGARPLIQPDANTVAHVRFVGASRTRTNLAVQSQALGTTWTGVGAVAAAPTVTNNSGDLTAPDATSTATKIVIPAVTATTGASYVKQDITAATATYTGSIWLRTASGTATVWIWFGNPAAPGTHYGQVSCAVTATWTRFQFAVALTAGSKNFAVGVDTRDSVQGSQAGQTVYAWGAQMELGSTATLYITTTTAAVTVDDALVDLKGRTADVLTGNQWKMTGTVPQVARSGRTPGQAGPFSDTQLFSLGAGSDVLDFASDFTCHLIFVPTTLDVTFRRVFANATVNASGYELSVTSTATTFSVHRAAASASATAGASTANVVNLASFGRASGTNYIKLNGAATVSTVAAMVQDAASVAKIGAGSAIAAREYLGSVAEIMCTSTAFTEAAAVEAAARVRARVGAGW